MKDNNILNYSQLSSYHLINFIIKQRILFLSTNYNRHNLGFKININDNENEYILRSAHKLSLPFYRKTIGQFIFNYRAAIIYIAIPPQIATQIKSKINKKI